MRAVAAPSQLGIVLNHTPAFAAEKTPADLHAARIADGLDVRWYMDPLFRGAYPADAIEHLGADAPDDRARRHGPHPPAAGLPGHQPLHAQLDQHARRRRFPRPRRTAATTWAGRSCPRC
jgi:hypothetical protein